MKDTIQALNERKASLIKRRDHFDVKDLDSRIAEAMSWVGKLNEERESKISMSRNINIQIENINHALTTIELELGLNSDDNDVVVPDEIVELEKEESEHE